MWWHKPNDNCKEHGRASAIMDIVSHQKCGPTQSMNAKIVQHARYPRRPICAMFHRRHFAWVTLDGISTFRWCARKERLVDSAVNSGIAIPRTGTWIDDGAWWWCAENESEKKQNMWIGFDQFCISITPVCSKLQENTNHKNIWCIWASSEVTLKNQKSWLTIASSTMTESYFYLHANVRDNVKVLYAGHICKLHKGSKSMNHSKKLMGTY